MPRFPQRRQGADHRRASAPRPGRDPRAPRLYESGPVPRIPEPTPIGKADVVRAGGDITIVAASLMAVEALHAADELAPSELTPRWSTAHDPPARRGDNTGIGEKTGRLVVADTSWLACGLAGRGGRALRRACIWHLRRLRSAASGLPNAPRPSPFRWRRRSIRIGTRSLRSACWRSAATRRTCREPRWPGILLPGAHTDVAPPSTGPHGRFFGAGAGPERGAGSRRYRAPADPQLLSAVEDFEIIIVNDGSTDSDRRNGRTARPRRAPRTPSREPTATWGLATAMRAGSARRAKTHFVYVPGDNTWPESSIGEILRHLGEGRCHHLIRYQP